MMIKTAAAAAAAAAGHAAASLCFTIRAGQYNVLAASLSSNIKPWFWYGCRGIVPNEPYTGDAFDAARVAAFGYGRSRKLAALWSTLKQYLRLFDTEECYGYNVDKLSTYQLEGDEGPSTVLKHQLEAAFVDFFHRNATNHVHGDKYLPYQLFDPASHDFSTISCSLLIPLGYSLASEDWTTAERLKASIQAAPAGTLEHMQYVDTFNAWLRRHFVVQRRHRYPSLEHFALPPARVEEEFKEVALEMATFMALNDADLRRLIAYQHELEWAARGEKVAAEIGRMGVDVLGLEEVDRVGFLRRWLAPRLRLAAFKHRKVVPKDDGCALFYDPEVLALRRVTVGDDEEADEGPAVAVVRYSGEAEAKQRAAQQTPTAETATATTTTTSAFPPPPPLPLFMTRVPIRGGIIGSETGEVKAGISDTEVEMEGGEDEVVVVEGKGKEERVDLWVFAPPEELKRGGKALWDERVAVVAMLEHKATGRPFLAACTHLAHSQDKPEAEAVRAAQVRQLDRALTEIQRRWGLMSTSTTGGGSESGSEGEGVPVVLMMDGNDTPHLAAYGPHRCAAGGGAHTPMYRALTQELGWRDCLEEDYGATSITLARRLRIDYVLSKDARGGRLVEAESTPALDVRLAGLDAEGRKVLVPREEEAARAVYGLPLPAIGGQPCIPSDHLYVSAHLTFAVEAPVGEETEGAAGQAKAKKEL